MTSSPHGGPDGAPPGSLFTPRHEPVMLREALVGLDVRPGGLYVDATAGLGGHSAAIAEIATREGAPGRILSIDRDPAAVAIAGQRLTAFGDAATVVHSPFAAIAEVCHDHGLTEVDGILFDLGVSSMQLDEPGRGFSFQRNEPLDMRMDPGERYSAADIVNDVTETELATIIYEYGEEHRSRRIARAIVERRPLHTTAELVAAIEAAVGRGRARDIHPATLTFQAIRIAVNSELDQIDEALEAARTLLRAPGGRLVIISFHSLEDRRVKTFFRLHASDCICPPRQPVCTCDHRATLREVTRRPLRPSADEVARNPRSRSARLRVAERLANPDASPDTAPIAGGEAA